MKASYLARCLIVLTVVLILSGCSIRNAKPDLGVEERYRKAMEMLEKEDYAESIKGFQLIIYTYPGSQWIDDAQFGLAESYFGSRDYINAIFEYQRIVNDFPLSEYADDAQFKIGMCFFERSPGFEYDQESTRRAIEEFERFLEDYPDSELVDEAESKISDCRNKLAKKNFETGKLYRKLGHINSAMIYFEEVIKNYDDSDWFLKSKYEIGEILLMEGKIEEAIDTFRSLAEQSLDREVRRKAKIRIEEIELGLKGEADDFFQ